MHTNDPGLPRPESEDWETSDEGEWADIDSLDNRHLYRDDRAPDSDDPVNYDPPWADGYSD